MKTLYGTCTKCNKLGVYILEPENENVGSTEEKCKHCGELMIYDIDVMSRVKEILDEIDLTNYGNARSLYNHLKVDLDESIIKTK